MTEVMVRPIRTEADYEDALARVAELMDAESGTEEADELDVLSLLIEHYEDQIFPIAPPTPLAAIQFRMEQQNLTARDLEPIIGSRSRVSEVLSGARPLSLEMIRALYNHLDIPAHVLITEQEPAASKPLALPKAAEKMLVHWGLLQAKEELGAFLSRACGGTPALAMLRKTRTERTNSKTDLAALQAWCAGAILRSQRVNVHGGFDPASLSDQCLRTLAKLSAREDGPALVREKLSALGIALIVLPHLPGTHLDGAALLRPDGVPVVALTLRRDRVDNFWFTLLHELVHVARHLTRERQVILDDLEIGSSSLVEQEADRQAQEALIPSILWRSFNNSTYTSGNEITALAELAGVNPAIVAGRWQMENRNYQKFSKMLGHRSIRRHFPELSELDT